MIPEGAIVSGFISKIINDLTDITIDKIKSADKNRQSKNQSFETRIYQVLIDSINEFTYGKYKNQDILYDVTENILNGFQKEKAGKIEVVASGLNILTLHVDEDICKKFIRTLDCEISKEANFDVYKEILILQEQESENTNEKIRQLKMQLRRIKNLKLFEFNDDLGVESLLKKNSRKYSKKIYIFVIMVLFILQIFKFFGVSNYKERIISIFLVIVLFSFSKLSGKVGKWINNIYICLLLICVIVSSVVQKPFMGIFSEKDNREKFYNKFAQGLYEDSIGNAQEAMDIYKEIKSYVPDDEVLDYYMWYFDAAGWANDTEVIKQLVDETTEKITLTTALEAEVLYKLLPIRLMIYDINCNMYEDLLQKILPYQNANEEIFILFEILARCHLEIGTHRYDMLESLFLKLQNCEDSFANYDYVKKGLLKLIIQEISASDQELVIIAMADLYARDHAEFFEDYIWIYPQQHNFGNLRWISMECLQNLRNQFRTGWNQIQKAENPLYSAYKGKLLDLGLFLGVTDVLIELEQKQIDFSRIDSINASYLDEKSGIYNILQIEDGWYIFCVFVGSYEEVDRVDFYTIDFNSHNVAEPIMIDGEPLQEVVHMGKLFLLEYTGVPGKYINAIIRGTSEGLQLSILDLNKRTFTQLAIKEDNYHCGDFIYNMETMTCQWRFEINNNIDANMWTKVRGRAIAKINFDELLLKIQTVYSDPALQFYAEERNEQLIFPLATLNKLGEREIKDEFLLELIRSNCLPYYHYSYVQDTIDLWSDVYIPNISGIIISYISENDNLSDFKYFFLVKREKEKIKVLGIYRITENGLKSVYYTF